MKDSNKIMRDAYSEAIKNNQIVKTQMEIEIEKNFDEKLQLVLLTLGTHENFYRDLKR